MIRLLFLLHRYLGIAVGLLMAMWCLSGVVMMYVSYPNLDENSRLHNLTPIDWSGCCRISGAVLRDSDRISEFQIETLAGRPVLRLRSLAASRLVDLNTGLPMTRVSAEQAAAVANGYAKSQAPAARLLGSIDHDQWTVAGGFSADRPLYHFGLGDAGRTELYVSSTTGHVVQVTTGHERFWNCLGSVPHWLYFTELRRRPALWTQFVIVVSVLGCFLVGTGIYIGVRQLATHTPAWQSPYTGINGWHHIAGLMFGAFALTWILSGLLSMNPWGLFEGTGAQRERALLHGASDISGVQIKAALQAVAAAHPPDIVSVKMAPLNGRPYFIASTADGNQQRLDAAAAPVPLSHADLAYIAGALGGNGTASGPSLLTREDTYYFSHHRDIVPLPVYRIVLGDESATRYYIDAVSGTLIAKIDRGARGYRWWHEGLHRMDFTAALRRRPQWDALMLLLMSGVTALCMTGAYLGYRRLLRS
jgi:uncharacterized iron-regulated membrane protein